MLMITVLGFGSLSAEEVVVETEVVDSKDVKEEVSN